MPNITDYGGNDVSGLTMNYSLLGSGGNSVPSMGSAVASGGGLLGMGGTGFTAAGVGGVVSDIGSAIGDIYSASADNTSAGQYDAAAEVALENKQITAGSLITQTAQAQRQFNMVQGAQTTQIAGAGFNTAGSGTAQALQRAGQEQFSVNMNTIMGNNYTQQQSYQEQATADENAAKAAKGAAGGSLLGAGFSAVAAIASVAMMA